MNQRKKWIHFFESVTAVFFFASLTGYCEMLEEDTTLVNHLIPKHSIPYVVTLQTTHSKKGLFTEFQYLCSYRANSMLKRGYIEFKYYADAIHSGLTPPGLQ